MILSSFVFGNTQQFLLAGIGEPYDPKTGKGVVGKNYCYQFEAGGEAFFEGREFNPFMGAPGMSIAIDDFNGENFDHSGLGFFGGGYIVCANGGAPPIDGRALPKGEPRWGAGWKQADSEMVSLQHPLQHAGLGLCPPRQFHGPRSDLQGCARPAADPADLQRAPRTTTRCRAIWSRRWKASSRR